VVNKVVIIIPIYNEKDVIADTLKQLFSITENTPGYHVEILVFDSQSTDGSAELVHDLQQTYPRLHLASEPKKSGLGSAYHQAFQFAISKLYADIVFEFDADGSHQPKYLPSMLTLFSEGADVVVGSRYVPGGSIPNDWGAHRKLLFVFGNWIARKVLTSKYKDFTSGFRGTRTHILEKILPIQFMSKNYAYKLQLFWLLHQCGAKITEYPIEFIDRCKGYSKFPRNNILESLQVIFALRLLTLRRYFMMCMVGLIGAGLQFVVFNIFRHHLSPVSSNIIATEFAVISNFLFNNWIVFKASKSHTLIKRLLKFNVCSLGSILLQAGWLFLGVKLFGRGLLVENALVATGMILGSISNYFLYSLIVWE